MLNLQYFSNTNAYNKCFKNNNSEKYTQLYNKKEYRFYKKRILQLVKDVMRKKNKEPNLVHAFDNFIKISIEHLKFIDKADIFQQDLSNHNLTMERSTTQKNFTESPDDLLFSNCNVKYGKIEDSIPLIIKRKAQPPIFIPSQKNLNLKDPKYKTKGIKKYNKLTSTFPRVYNIPPFEIVNK
jgi:hypothetical protein